METSTLSIVFALFTLFSFGISIIILCRAESSKFAVKWFGKPLLILSLLSFFIYVITA